MDAAATSSWQWLYELLQGDSVTHAILVLSLVSALGLLLGGIRVFGISLGFSGVLFAGLTFGHFKVTINPHVLEFAREFGLILFVYTIGVQVGPGFFGSLRKNGLPLNLLAAGIVLSGMLLTVLIWYFGGVHGAVAVGLFSGATTNTPSLGAAQQALKELKDLPANFANLPGLGYAVAYPFGIIGVILSMGLVRRVFRIKVADELAQLERAAQEAGSELETRNFVVMNPNLEGLPIKRIPAIDDAGVLISRILHQGEVRVAHADTILHTGDVVLAVGKPGGLEEVRIAIGADSEVDLRALPSTVTARRLIVTRKEVIGKTPRTLDFQHKYGVTLTRIIRADMEFTPSATFGLQFGDRVVAVGEEQAVKQVAEVLGNSSQSLEHPEVVPIFVGIVLGVLVGSCPIEIPGAPAALKLGLAGGPLIVAILLSRLGHFRKIVWYMPASANYVLREVGILLFLTCVGLKSGDKFVETLVSGDGVRWIAYAGLITVVPVLLMATVGRLFLKLNYLSLCGLMAGSMTDPPALAFANSIAASQAPSVAYATVYPLTMLLRVLGAQLLVFFLVR